MPDPSAFPTAQAPRTQGFLDQPDPGDEESLFVQGFGDLAYKAIAKSQPTLLASVVTFRVLEKDVQNGEAVGTFIVKQGDEVLFIPVVLVDNAVKPLDLVYCRSRDRYYPLTPEWLREISTSGVSRMGSSVDVPKSLTTDVDIRNLVVPPSVGRYSYAEDTSWSPFANLRRELPAPEADAFPHALRSFDDRTKVAVQRMLQMQPKVAQILCEQYGVPSIRDALTVMPSAKVAAEDRRETPMKHDVYLATASTPLQELHRELEPGEVANAYGTARARGFFIKDRRQRHADLVALSEESLRLTEPETPGLYRVYMTDGQIRVALIVPNPDTIHRRPGDEDASRYGRYARNNTNRDRAGTRRYLVLFPDGKFAYLTQVLAEQVAASYDDVLDFLEPRAKPAPGGSGCGCLVTLTRLTLRVTQPEYASDVTTGEGRTTFNLGGCHGVTKVRGSLGGVVKPQGQDAVLIGDDTIWWPCDSGRWVEGDFLSSPAQVWTLIERGLTKAGAWKLQVRRATDGDFLIGEERAQARGVEAVVKVASVYGLSIADAATALQAVSSKIPVKLWAKQADGPPPGGGAPAQGDPNGAPPADPSMMGAPPPPPPPPGLDLVLAEKRTLIQQQVAALQQQAALLDEIQARALGVDQGGPMSAPQGMMTLMGAPPPSMLGGPALAPVGGAAAPAPPSAGPPQGGPGTPAMPPGAAPGPSAAAMPGMPPTPMAAPGQQAPQAPPVMAQAPTPETLAQQVNPAFLNDAALLGDPQVFDAAAVASFAKPKALREILQNYAPSLDSAVDKLGRALLLLYTQTRDVRDKIGDEAHREMEQRVRDVFRGLGDALLMLKEHGDQLSPTGLRPS